MAPPTPSSASKQKRKRPLSEEHQTPDATKRSKMSGRRSSTRGVASPEAQPTETNLASLIDPKATIKEHSVDHDTGIVRLEIQSRGRSMTVDEIDLQAQAPDKLFQYYASFGVPREQTLGYDGYRVFAILKDGVRKGRKLLLVHWVGYPAAEATWEPEEVPRESDGDIVDTYWEAKDRMPANKGAKSKHKQGGQALEKGEEKDDKQGSMVEADAEVAMHEAAGEQSTTTGPVVLLLEDVDNGKLERLRRVLEREVPDVRFSILQVTS